MEFMFGSRPNSLKTLVARHVCTTQTAPPLRCAWVFSRTRRVSTDVNTCHTLSTRLGKVFGGQGDPKSLIGLPVEVQVVIFEHIHNAQDAICFAVTCKLLREVGEERVYALMNPPEGPWAGDRLICVGDYVSNTHMPTGTMTAEELASGENLYHLATEYKVISSNLPTVDARFVRSLPKPDRKRFMELFGQDKQKVNRVLCNLTKRQFVKEETVKRYSENAASLGDALLMLICWTDDPERTLEGRGRWAGDQIEITLSDQMEERREGWVDVGENLGEKMERIRQYYW